MKISLKEIGKIQKADISVEGLTVIAGKNDTGKSSVSKVLYGIIKGINSYSDIFEDHALYNLRINVLLPLLQSYSVVMKKENPLSQEIIHTIDILRRGNPWDKENITKEKILSLVNHIKDTKYENLTPEITKKIDIIFQEFEKIQNTQEEIKLQDGLNTKLNEIFFGNINNSKYHKDSTIEVFNQENKILSFTVFNELCKDVTCDFLKVKSLYGKVIYIETPFVLDNRFPFVDKPNWRDMWSLFYNYNSQNNHSVSANTSIVDFIQKEIFREATFGIDRENARYYYQVDKESSKISLLNSACGIRSFALLLSLLRLDYITKDSLVLIDEPENHLHPEWQIKYAQLICLLVKEGFSAVINSHSPTFIQALGAFSNKYNIVQKSSFYLAEQMENFNNYSTITDVTENVEKIYENLVTPTEKLFAGV